MKTMLLLTLAAFLSPITTAGEAQYCVFSNLTPGVPSFVDIYRIDEQPCVVTQLSATKTIRLEQESSRKTKGPVYCDKSAVCTAKNEYFLDGQNKPFVVIFRAPRV